MPRTPSADSVLGPILEQSRKDIVVKPVDILGKTFHATNAAPVTVFLEAISNEEAGTLLPWLQSLVIESERAALVDHLNTIEGFNGDAMIALANWLIEQCQDRPTEPSPPSSTTSATRSASGTSRGVSQTRVSRSKT